MRCLGMVRAVLLVRWREAIDAPAAHGGAARRPAVPVEDAHAPRGHVDARGGGGGAEGGEARALLAHPVEVDHEVVQVQLGRAAQLVGGEQRSEAHRLGLRRRARAPPWVKREQPPGGGCSGRSGRSACCGCCGRSACCGCSGRSGRACGGCGGCGSVGYLGAPSLRRCATNICGGRLPRRAWGVLRPQPPHLAAPRRVRLLHLAHGMLEVDNVALSSHHHLGTVLEGRQRRFELRMDARLLVGLKRPAQLDLPDRPTVLAGRHRRRLRTAVHIRVGIVDVRGCSILHS